MLGRLEDTSSVTQLLLKRQGLWTGLLYLRAHFFLSQAFFIIQRKLVFAGRAEHSLGGTGRRHYTDRQTVFQLSSRSRKILFAFCCSTWQGEVDMHGFLDFLGNSIVIKTLLIILTNCICREGRPEA